jgi:hypothetical protein
VTDILFTFAAKLLRRAERYRVCRLHMFISVQVPGGLHQVKNPDSKI